MSEDNIQAVSSMEAERLPSMCEIRFDANVVMYESGYRKNKGVFSAWCEEKPNPPQWFRNNNTLTLDAIRHCDPYVLGIRLKDMLRQLDSHIKQYEKS